LGRGFGSGASREPDIKFISQRKSWFVVVVVVVVDDARGE
jgi:hypothetical protein